jgi:hypothetical protein
MRFICASCGRETDSRDPRGPNGWWLVLIAQNQGVGLGPVEVDALTCTERCAQRAFSGALVSVGDRVEKARRQS